MIKSYIEAEHEFKEVLNAFPVLEGNLRKMEFDLNNIREDMSVHDFFLHQNLDEEEISFFIRKMNEDVNVYLKKKKDVSFNSPIRNIKTVMVSEEEE